MTSRIARPPLRPYYAPTMRAPCWLLAGLLLSLASACDRPTTTECRQAVANIQRVLAVDTDEQSPVSEAAVRKCRAQSTRKVVQCTIVAKTPAELDACEAKKP